MYWRFLENRLPVSLVPRQIALFAVLDRRKRDEMRTRDNDGDDDGGVGSDDSPPKARRFRPPPRPL